jgi:hypothetical protein
LSIFEAERTCRGQFAELRVDGKADLA